MILAPGVWTDDDDDDTMHIDIDACLLGNGYEPNEQTRRMLEATWRDMGRQLGVDVVIEPDCRGDARFNTEQQASYVADGLTVEFAGSRWNAVAHEDHWHVREGS